MPMSTVLLYNGQNLMAKSDHTHIHTRTHTLLIYALAFNIRTQYRNYLAPSMSMCH